jgi:DNA-binding MarR family transcriptional regulator
VSTGSVKSGADFGRSTIVSQRPAAGTTGRHPADAAYSRLEQELAVLLRRARAYSQDIARELHPELHATAYAMLAQLLEGPSRASELCAYFGVDKSAVSRQLRLLEDLGFIAREADPADGRAQLLVLTAEGRRRLTKARDARRARMRQQLDRWDEPDVAALGDLLARFNRSHLQAMVGDEDA